MKKMLILSRDFLSWNGIFATIAVPIALALSGCVTEGIMVPSDWPASPTPSDTSPFKEVYEAGLTKYVGESFIRPTSVTRVELSPPIDIYHFSKSDTERGPLCMDGSDFTVEASDGSLLTSSSSSLTQAASVSPRFALPPRAKYCRWLP